MADTIRQRYSIELERFEPDSHALLAAIDEQKRAHSRREKRRATMESKRALEEGFESSQAEEAGAAAEPEPAEEPGGDTLAGAEDGPDWAFVEMVIGELKQRLDAMGPVNLDAIEEFEALQERYDFLTKEHDDLVSSKQHLHNVITKINRETRTRFADTFDVVQVSLV